LSPLTDIGNGVSLCHESLGSGDCTVVLIAGRGGQLTDWHDELVAQLVDLDYRVIRFDNRDSGLSTHLDDATVDLSAVYSGAAGAPYSLDDMGEDAARLLQVLDVTRAVVVGLSLGGMVAQCLALRHPEMVQGLVLLSTTTGARDVGQPSPEVQQAMIAGATAPKVPATDPVAAVVQSSARWTSWDLGVTQDELQTRIQARFDRRYDIAGAQRHMAAVLAASDRTDDLRSVRVPTVVIHGVEDPLVDVSGGKALADVIPDAELVLVDKLKHDMPRAIWPVIVDAVERVRAGNSPV
jgi:pimeloyl-ACP methyl ester carboxylesterase